MPDLDWRAWLDKLGRLWRSSLQVRTVAITVLLSAVAVFVIGGYMSFSVGTNLFDSRRVDLTATSEKATLAGQRIFSEAAVVVFPYTSTTGSSGVLHQAGSYAKAVVLPHIGDLAEIVSEEGYAGELFEPDDPATLAQAIAALLDSPQRRQELGLRNYYAARGLPIADVVDWYLLHFEAILAERRGGGKRMGLPAQDAQRSQAAGVTGVTR